MNNIRKVVETLRKIGWAVNDPATDVEIERLRTGAEKRLGVEIPNEHILLLKQVNGFSFNGYNIYGVDGELLESRPKADVYDLIGLNEMWSDNDEKRWLYLADSDIYYYAYKPDEKIYYRLTLPMKEEDKKYNSYDEMMSEIIDDSEILSLSDNSEE